MKRAADVFEEMLMKEAEPQPPSQPVTVPAAASAQGPKPVTAKNLFSHPEAHPVVLDMALLKKFQLQWLSWLPDTLFHEIELEFKTSIAEVNRLKIQAIKLLHTVDSFWDQWEIFEKTVQALNGTIPRLEVLQPPDLPSLFTGVDIASGVRQEAYSEEVARYCAAIFIHQHVTYAPDPMAFCQEYISQPTYRCKDCGKTGSALPPFDGFCPSCTLKFEQEHAFSMKPDPEAVKRGHGQVDYSLILDPAPVKKRFEEFEHMPAQKLETEIKEVPDDIEAARLVVATDFMNFRRGQLKDQLTSLRGWLEQA